jgi:hypothetical protein
MVSTRVMAGFQVGLLLLLLGGWATSDWPGCSQQEHDRQDIVVAHPEWPPEILGAVASGVISVGMSSDMVRAAWGSTTRISSNGSGPSQRDTWHYTRRQHASQIIGGQAASEQPWVEWTVSFANGWVVGWTE